MCVLEVEPNTLDGPAEFVVSIAVLDYLVLLILYLLS